MTREQLQRASVLPSLAIVSTAEGCELVASAPHAGRRRVVGRGRLRLSHAACEALLEEIRTAMEAGWRAGLATAVLAIADERAPSEISVPERRSARIGGS